MAFTCSICGEESTRICARCTKDACPNHVCERCGRCSDCCECEVAIAEPARGFTSAAQAIHQPPADADSESTEAGPAGPSVSE